MKKDRNCGYPVYPNMGGMPMPLPMYPNQGFYPNYNTEANTSEINMLEGKINNLEKRVNALENIVKQNYNNYNNYSTNNYQMM